MWKNSNRLNISDKKFSSETFVTLRGKPTHSLGQTGHHFEPNEMAMELHVNLNRKIDDIQRKLRECNYECNRLKEIVTKSFENRQETVELTTQENPVADPVQPTVETVNTTTETPQVQETTVSSTPEPISPTVETPSSITANLTNRPQAEPRRQTTQQETSRQKEKPANQVKKSRISAQMPSTPKNMEEFIGGNILNKVGIGILIIGIGIFVKYAIDQNWINEVGRVFIGLLSGGILMGIAHRLRKSYKAFSSVLLGGGIAVLYFTVAIAFHQYQLIGQTAAFAIMTVITGAAVFFSIAYDRVEIAVLALLGGFATPFMVSNGSGNYIALFTYLLVLNVGMMVLSWFREWQIIRVLSYGITLILFGGWLAMNLFISEEPVLGGALAFGTVYFLVFFAMNLAFNVKAQKKLGALEYIMLFSNTMFYFAGSMLTLSHIQDGRFLGLFTALMAAFHFAFIYPVRRLIKVDNNLQIMLIGLVLTFLTLAIPIQLEGSFITLFWAAEAVVVLVLAQRSGIKLLRQASYIVSGLAAVALVWDWALFYFDSGFPSGRAPFFNGVFVTSMFTALTMVVQYFLYKREGEKYEHSPFLSQLFQFAALPVLYFGMLFELVDLTLSWQNTGLMTIAIVAFSATFLCGMQVWALKDKRKDFGNFILVTSLLGFVGFLAATLWHSGTSPQRLCHRLRIRRILPCAFHHASGTDRSTGPQLRARQTLPRSAE